MPKQYYNINFLGQDIGIHISNNVDEKSSKIVQRLVTQNGDEIVPINQIRVIKKVINSCHFLFLFVIKQYYFFFLCV